MSARPTIRIRLRYDLESGEFDLIVDDSAPDMPESYHDAVAARVAAFLSQNPQIADAGLRHVVWGEQRLAVSDFATGDRQRPQDALRDG
jgi:hypothetical protein